MIWRKTKSPRICKTGTIVCQRLAAKGFNDLFEKTKPDGITVDCERAAATNP